MKLTAYLPIFFVLLTACGAKNELVQKKVNPPNSVVATTKDKNVACKLTSKELRERKETVIEHLRNQMTEKRELKNGYAFRFPGTDEVIDELTEFIKTERECCSFFTFGLSVSGDKNEVWLELTGDQDAKEMIRSELNL